MEETRKMSREKLLEMGMHWDVPEGFKEISRETTDDSRRWTKTKELIFQFPEQVGTDTAYRLEYEVGATECQEDTDPWSTETVELQLVRRMTKTIEVWQ